MGDDLDLPERTCARTPMQWSNDKNGGFTTADKAVMPVIDHGGYGYKHVNVADQRRDPDSLLNWMERVVRMRKELPEISWGDFKIVPVKARQVLAMHFTWRQRTLLIVHNLDANPQEIALRLDKREFGPAGDLINLLSQDHSRPDGSGRHCIVLEPYGYRWFRAGGSDRALRA